jgi:hypothetical protein
MGRIWETDTAEGFWRSFAELDLTAPDAITGFVRRRGLPFPLGAEGDWSSLQRYLQIPAGAWEPADENGDSLFSTDPSKLKFAEGIAVRIDRPLLEGGFRAAPDPKGRPRLVHEATSLAAFMAASALMGLNSRLPMRRCRHCDSWFYRARKDALFCSASCRTLFSIERKKGE